MPHSAAGFPDLAGEYREGMVLTAAYREYLSAIATSAGALTGLLFVAVSAAPRRGSDAPAVIQQVRAAAALVAFFNALAVSIFGLVPGGERQVSSCRAGHRRTLVYRRWDAISLVQPVNDRSADRTALAGRLAAADIRHRTCCWHCSAG